MRRLVKGPCPDVLSANATAWTDDLLGALAQGQTPTKTQLGRYNSPGIKNAIKAETLEKCAYCESKIVHIDHGDIEHVIPKSKVPELAFDWDNLTLACRICNQNKGSFYIGVGSHSELVDPYRDNPEDHFLFYREAVIPRPDSDRGLLTDAEIGLSRAPLHERRRERMEFIDGLIRGYCNASTAIKPILRNDIYKRCCSEDSEYSAVATTYIDNVFAKIDN